MGIKSFKLDSIKTIMFYILNYTKYSLFKFNFISRLRPFFKRFLDNVYVIFKIFIQKKISITNKKIIMKVAILCGGYEPE